METFILNLPLYISIPLCILFGIAIAFFATYSKQKESYIESFRNNHDLTSYLFNAFGLIYAVLVAFVVFATWSDYQQAKLNCELEANQIEILYTISDGFEKETATVIKDNLRKYVNILINDEWNYLGEGKTSKEAIETLLTLKQIYFNIPIITQKESDLYKENLSRLNSMVEYRKMRIVNSQQQVPAILWLILCAGYLTCILYTYFFVSPSRRIHFISVAALLVFNTLVLYMIFVLDHPFSGFNSISVDYLDSVINFFELIDHTKIQ